ncbi:hypothetical protein ACGF5M_05525 [Gemmatimonadota bacterium]
MVFDIRRVDYFYAAVRDQPGEGYQILSLLEEIGINLLAFTAIPVGPVHTQLTLFPEDPGKMEEEATRAGLSLEGPHPALLVQGDDELGALVEVHRKLYAANVNIYAASGVADGRGGYGYVIYVRPKAIERALAALEV